ncbi:MAG: hypothetical protein KatS3mg057_3103 [Herpetosiphonaceae bacterium]|nr:MAG: hypothetical protein KatS3mg057_3103 [Herpetosiphonaceae bacterium]
MALSRFISTVFRLVRRAFALQLKRATLHFENSFSNNTAKTITYHNSGIDRFYIFAYGWFH